MSDSAVMEFSTITAELVEVSRSMEEFAASGEWDRVLELEAARQGLLQRAGKLARLHGLIDVYAEVLNSVRAANDALLARCHLAREQLSADIRELGQRRKADKTYGAYRSASR